MKFYFRSKSFKRIFRLSPFEYNLMIECSKKNWENYSKRAFKQRNIETWIKVEPWASTYWLKNWAQGYNSFLFSISFSSGKFSGMWPDSYMVGKHLIPKFCSFFLRNNRSISLTFYFQISCLKKVNFKHIQLFIFFCRWGG